MLRNITQGLILIAAPVVYLAGQSVLLQWGARGPDKIWFLSHTLLWVGTALFVPAIAGIVDYLGDRWQVLTRLGWQVLNQGL